MKTWLVYKHTSVDTGKVYIGMTKHSIEKRWKQHCQEAFNTDRPVTHFHNALKKYGITNWIHEVLISDIATLSEAEYTEKLFIGKYDSYEKGYNSTLGGGGVVAKFGEDHHFYGVAKNREAVEQSVATRIRNWNSMSKEEREEATKARTATLRATLGTEKYTIIQPETGVEFTGFIADINRELKLHKASIKEVVDGSRKYWHGWYLKSDDGVYERSYPLYKFTHKEYGEELLTLVGMVKKYNLPKGNLHAVMQGKRNHCKGWNVVLEDTVFNYNIGTL